MHIHFLEKFVLQFEKLFLWWLLRLTSASSWTRTFHFCVICNVFCCHSFIPCVSNSDHWLSTKCHFFFHFLSRNGSLHLYALCINAI